VTWVTLETCCEFLSKYRIFVNFENEFDNKLRRRCYDRLCQATKQVNLSVAKHWIKRSCCYERHWRNKNTLKRVLPKKSIYLGLKRSLLLLWSDEIADIRCVCGKCVEFCISATSNGSHVALPQPLLSFVLLRLKWVNRRNENVTRSYQALRFQRHVNVLFREVTLK